MINVAKPFLPPYFEYEELLKGTWGRGWLTNHGPLSLELEDQLRKFLNINNLLFVNNGTIAIQIAIKALDLKGEIITSPFSFVATTSTIVWENCTPVFADIDPDTFNIDVEKIESLITPRTSAILATHVFGNPCNIDYIMDIARRNNLKVIFDAAHCFGTKYKGKHVVDFGDISTLSFHATKLYHTVEGGAIIAQDEEIIQKSTRMMNFGYAGDAYTFDGVGINGKNSEFHAAMGLCNLKYIDTILEKRKQQFLFYNKIMERLDARRQKINSPDEYNYSYYPLVFNSENELKNIIGKLNANGIHPRRYFYPSLSKLNYLKNNSCKISEDISSRILCLPIYHDLTEEEQLLIARIILNA